MKIYEIKSNTEMPSAYLFYYEGSKTFFIEIIDDVDVWNIPFLLASLAENKKITIDSKWSREWVLQRIVPADRQNIGSVLKAYGLSSYDEHKLLVKSCGRCEQDDFYISEISENELPIEIRNRLFKKISYFLMDNSGIVKLLLKSGETLKFDLLRYLKNEPLFGRYYEALSNNSELLSRFTLSPGGTGLLWEGVVEIVYTEIYKHSEPYCFSYDERREYLTDNVITTSEAMDILGCSRQNLGELVKNGKLFPIKTTQKAMLFLKEDIMDYYER